MSKTNFVKAIFHSVSVCQGWISREVVDFQKKMKQIKVTVADLCFDGNTQKKSWSVSEKGKKRDITSDG